MHREAVTAAGAELIQFARSVGLIGGEWIAIDGSKSRAASSARSVLDREALQRYLDQMENADSEQETTVDGSAVTSALEKLRRHPEPGYDRPDTSGQNTSHLSTEKQETLPETGALPFFCQDPTCVS